jgi:hypothetical protein
MENNHLYTFKEWFINQKSIYADLNLLDKKVLIFDDRDFVINVTYLYNKRGVF